MDKYERTIRKEGVEEGSDQFSRLPRLLLAQNRMEDLKHAAEDSAYREKLFRELGI